MMKTIHQKAPGVVLAAVCLFVLMVPRPADAHTITDPSDLEAQIISGEWIWIDPDVQDIGDFWGSGYTGMWRASDPDWHVGDPYIPGYTILHLPFMAEGSYALMQPAPEPLSLGLLGLGLAGLARYRRSRKD